MIEAKHQVKRLFARVSFASILLIAAAVVYCVFTADENTARALEAATGIISSVITFLTLIVLAYMGIVHHDSLKTGGKDE